MNTNTEKIDAIEELLATRSDLISALIGVYSNAKLSQVEELAAEIIVAQIRREVDK